MNVILTLNAILKPVLSPHKHTAFAISYMRQFPVVCVASKPCKLEQLFCVAFWRAVGRVLRQSNASNVFLSSFLSLKASANGTRVNYRRELLSQTVSVKHR